jgi:hypothetical protein
MQKTNTLENNIVDESLQGSLVDTTKECVSSDLKDENKFRSIDMKTVKMIIEQAMGYGRVTEPGEWLGDIIGVSDSMPEGYLLLKKLYMDR